MKNLLTKTLFISLLLSTTVPSNIQAGFFNGTIGTTLKNGAEKIFNKTANYLSENTPNFLKKHQVAVKGAAVALAVTAAAWKLSKVVKQRKLNNNLWEAITERNVTKAREALEMGADANTQTWLGFTALMYAGGHQEIAELLINSGAEINKQDYLSGRTALMFIVGLIGMEEFLANAQGYTVALPKVINTLLSTNEIDINKQDKKGNTALMYATGSGLLETTRKLLEHDADPYIKNNDGKNAFDLILSSRSASTEHEKEQFKIAMLKVIESKKN